ncbi:MAG: uracil-DNA glycosylase [Campylobacteraceae bacterium]|nr:uracil-DNA glycosylase [Campylobacteraceae bacterium]
MSRAYTLACYKAFGYKFIDENFLNKVCFFESLDELNECVKTCELCNLSKSRTKVLNLSQNSAKIMVVFDNPSKAQDESGDVFASKEVVEFRESLIKIAKLDEVYFTFLVKCRAPKNGTLEDEYIEKCSPYLFEEIDKVKPKLILSMGEVVTKALLKTNLNLDVTHGSVFRYQNSLVMPLYDLKFVLTNPSKKEFLLEDIKKIKELV